MSLRGGVQWALMKWACKLTPWAARLRVVPQDASGALGHVPRTQPLLMPHAELSVSPRQEMLLLYLGLPADGTNPGFTNPLRIMKGLFVFVQETPLDWRKGGATYAFEPYNYGPCSFAIYDDLTVLNGLGLLTTASPAGQDWNYYGLSERGIRLAKEIVSTWDARAVAYMSELKTALSGMNFSTLLRAVYAKYPEYAKNSLFRG
jgi:hypothetical protein